MRHHAGLATSKPCSAMNTTVDRAPAPESAPLVGTALGAAALLAACGGGGGDGAAAAAPPPPAASAPSDAEASRFLGQAGFGATDALITRVKALGYSGWLDEQLAAPRTQSHYDWMLAKGYGSDTNINSFAGTDNTLWRKLISSPDVLRQRATLALSEVFVVSMTGLPVAWRGFIAAAYADVLETHAFGNYRELLQAVTLSPGMGVYLNMRGNQKADSTTGRVPDENYAREVLQLFSLGLVELNTDGSVKRDANGKALETYGQDTISGLARVFTGWDYDGSSRVETSYTQRPMVVNSTRHEPGEKRFLGATVAAGTAAAAGLQQALDTIAGHANVAPFMARQLIQRLVSSNPSAAYVGRVAAVFNNNGAGVRGDLKAVP